MLEACRAAASMRHAHVVAHRASPLRRPRQQRTQRGDAPHPRPANRLAAFAPPITRTQHVSRQREAVRRYGDVAVQGAGGGGGGRHRVSDVTQRLELLEFLLGRCRMDRLRCRQPRLLRTQQRHRRSLRRRRRRRRRRCLTYGCTRRCHYGLYTGRARAFSSQLYPAPSAWQLSENQPGGPLSPSPSTQVPLNHLASPLGLPFLALPFAAPSPSIGGPSSASASAAWVRARSSCSSEV